MKLKEANQAAATFLIEFALGAASPADLESQEFFLALSSKGGVRVERLLYHYKLDGRFRALETQVAQSSAEVMFAEDGFIVMKDSQNQASFKIKSIDFYLAYYLGLSEACRYYPLLKFYLSFSPFLETFIFAEGIERLQG